MKMNFVERFHHWRRKMRWNKQYKKGRWDSLQSEKELHRYQRIIDLIKDFGTSNPSILDIGCGEGVLTMRMQGTPYAYFCGVDFSSVSIKKAATFHYPKSDFETADAIGYVPKQKFDVIIFNEAFYYIHNKEKSQVLQRMMEFLTPGGILITSIYREGIGCWEYFKDNPKLEELDFTTVKTNEDSRYWKIGAYKKTLS
jgi:2-polyprenyl-3-methyl-5-hydroxy-6-metoxy-1,4-benzoquinol methylase